MPRYLPVKSSRKSGDACRYTLQVSHHDQSHATSTHINDIKIIDVNGLPGFSGTSEGGSGGGTAEKVGTKDGSRSVNLADNVVSSALRYRAHQPFLDGLLKEIGMAPGEISNIRNILGDYENPKKDFHMNFDKDPTKGTKSSK